MGKLGSKWGNNDLDRVRLVSNYRCVFLDSTGDRALTKKKVVGLQQAVCKWGDMPVSLGVR